MIWVVGIIVAYFIFTNKALSKPSNTLSNAGGTSTPVPESNTPPFYQESNSATAARPTTKSSIDNTGALVNKQVTKPLITVFNNPIPLESISDTEQTSVGQENALAYSLPIESTINAPIGTSKLLPKVTFDYPSSVPRSGLVYYHEQAANIAPTPLPNPKLETVVPKVAAKITTPIKYVPPTLARSTFFNRNL